MEMTQVDLDHWLEALRSGKYPQGKERLHSFRNDDGVLSDHKFCCIGVLCEINKDKLRVDFTSAIGENRFMTRYDGQTGLMPTSLCDEYDIDDGLIFIPGKSLTETELKKLSAYSNGALLSENQMYSPMSLNDVGGISFARIADLLQQHVKIKEPA